MKALLQHPVFVLGILGALSGKLGTFALDLGFGEAPHPGLYMVLTGLWFGLVVAFGVWRFARASIGAIASVIAATWIAWEVAINIAMQITENWLKTAALSDTLTMSIGGFTAGAVGAFLTWAGAAASIRSFRRAIAASTTVAIGALLGLLLPWTNHFDDPAILLVPWQAGVAGVLGFALAGSEESRDPSAKRPRLPT